MERHSAGGDREAMAMPQTWTVQTRRAADIADPEARYKGFAPGTTLLRRGSRYAKGGLRLPCDIVREKDVGLLMRDGATLYADVYRPAGNAPVPAIVNWSPYGKGDTGYQVLDKTPRRFGIPKCALSGMQSWEGNDPAYWCDQGYAIVQVDARGAFDSEGDIIFHGSAEGRDGYDAVEGVAAMPWCSGLVGMAGNSWLAMAQWRIASERPPHLAAIAPWEGLTDLFHDVIARGGVPRTQFLSHLRDMLYGRGRIEDPVGMLEEHPVFDEYWHDKVVDVARINVPAYVVASYSNQLHSAGTLRAWTELTGQKWLRIHNSMEWPDFYDRDRVEELRTFFDRYLLGQDNGWETTPPVRLAVLDPGHQDTIDRPEATFPPKRVKPTELYLDACRSALVPTPVAEVSSCRYSLNDPSPHADFTYRFDTAIEIIGAPILSVWVSVTGHDDGDLHVYVDKLDRRGRQLWHQTVDLGLPLARTWMPVLHRHGVGSVAAAFYRGSDGMVRLSRRMSATNSPGRLVTGSPDDQRLVPGVAVEATVALWPVAMRWHAGEQLRLRVSGRCLLPAIDAGVAPDPLPPGDSHVVHTGGRYASRLILPMTPAS